MRLRFLPLLVLMAACGSPRDLIVEPAEVTLSTDDVAQRDPATGIALVQARVFNPLSQTVTLAACDGTPLVALERRSGGAWENAAAAICPANRSGTPVEVGANTGVQFTVTVGSPGSYRVVAMLTAGGQGSIRELRSDEFTVR